MVNGGADKAPNRTLLAVVRSVRPPSFRAKGIHIESTNSLHPGGGSASVRITFPEMVQKHHTNIRFAQYYETRFFYTKPYFDVIDIIPAAEDGYKDYESQL